MIKKTLFLISITFATLVASKENDSSVMTSSSLGLDKITLSESPLTDQFKEQHSKKIKVVNNSEEMIPLRGNIDEQALYLFVQDIQRLPRGSSVALCFQKTTRRYHKLIVRSYEQKNVLEKVRAYCQKHRSFLIAVYFKNPFL